MAAEDVATGGIVGAVTTLGGALLLWLRTRAQASAEVAKAQAEGGHAEASQVAVLAKCVEDNQKHLSHVLERLDRMSAKISAQSATIEELRARLGMAERERDRLITELEEAGHRIDSLSDHVDALTAQVEKLGEKPIPPPAPLGRPRKPASKAKSRSST